LSPADGGLAALPKPQSRRRRSTDDEPVEIACGHLSGSADEPQQCFTLWRIAQDRLELRPADGQAIGIGPTAIGGHEIAQAIEQVSGRTVTFDYPRSRLAW